MLTFHAIVRGFEGEFDHIQRNAIGSWLRLEPTPEILLFGDDEPGAAEFAEEMGLPIYPLERNHRGIPLVKGPIERARELASYDVRCLVNADIMLMDDFGAALSQVADRFPEFLMITQRIGLEVGGELSFERGWQRRLVEELQKRGRAKHRKAVDYFAYRGGWLSDVPDFAVGRTSWDNWIVWKALSDGVPVVEVTPVSICIHQEHYKKRKREETEENRAILGDIPVCGLDNATWILTWQGLVKK